MSGDVLRLLLRDKAGRTTKPAHARPPAERITRKDMIARRDYCIVEIARLRSDTNASGNLADKALQLLTRHWSVSSWRARSDILRTAEWLLGISRKAADASSTCASHAGGPAASRNVGKSFQ
jgi:hypothetical protein